MTDPTTEALRDSGPLGEAFADTMPPEGYADEGRPLPAPPAVLMPGTDGQLDIDGMRAVLPEVRTALVMALRHAATMHRQARGTVVAPEDTYPLVRRLTEAGEVLRGWGSAFLAAAAEADSLTEEEALTVSGAELDGVLLASLFVPDGEGQRIAVRAEYGASTTTWDVPSLVGWLIDDEAADVLATLRREAAEQPYGDESEAKWDEDAARTVARNVVARLIGLDGVTGLGKFTPQARAVEALRQWLAEQQRDADAAVLRQVRTTERGPYKGVKITREASPKGGRA